MWLIPSTLGRKLISDAQISHEAKLVATGRSWTTDSLFTITDRLSCTADTAVIHPSISCSILRYLKSSIWGTKPSPSWSGSEWAIHPFEDHGLRFTGAEFHPSRCCLLSTGLLFPLCYLHYFFSLVRHLIKEPIWQVHVAASVNAHLILRYFVSI